MIRTKKMIDGMKFYEKSKLKDGNFVKVKGNQLKFYEYTLAGEVNLDCDTEKSFPFWQLVYNARTNNIFGRLYKSRWESCR